MHLLSRCGLSLAFFYITLGFMGCSAPRQVMLSPHTTPKGKFTGGYQAGYQASSAVLGELNRSVLKRIEAYTDDDSTTVLSDDAVQDASKMLVAQGVDPIGASSRFYLAYGIFPHTEIGYEYLGFGHGLWMRYQIMGGEPGSFSGTTGLYASRQNYELPSLFSKVQDALGYEIQRTDFTIPLSVGHLKKWRWVSLEWGGVIQAQLTQIRYEFAPTTAYEVVSENGGEPFLKDIPQQRHWFMGGGASVNGRLGLGPVFMGLGLGFYYSDYGTYTIPGNRTVDLSGGAFALHYALELRFW